MLVHRTQSIVFQGPASSAYTCYCTPFIKRFEQKMDKNKRELVKHLESTHGKLATRISHLERKTKDHISSLSNSMKETIAQVSSYQFQFLLLHLGCKLALSIRESDRF